MKHEDQMFIVGLVSLIFSLFLFPCVAYLFPAVWLGWDYNIPSFVVNAALWIQTVFNITYALALEWFFGFTFLLAVIFGAIAYVISHHISQLQAEADQKEPEPKIGADLVAASKLSMKAKQSSKEAVMFFLKMVVIIMLVFIVSDMIQWAISLSSEPR